LSGLTPDRIASASGLANFLRTLGASFGTSLSVTLWDRRATLHDAHLSDNFTSANPAAEHAFAQLQGVGMAPTQAAEWLSHTVSRQAFMLATNDFFWLSGWIFVVLLGLVWFARPPFTPKGRTPVAAAE
jgi:MFS transporter, DHA2 family, multidrug resistance protein